MGMNCCNMSGGKDGEVKCSHHWMAKKIVMILVGLTLVVWLGTDIMLKNEQKRVVGRAPLERHAITVNADDKLVTKPDLATFTVGLESRGLKYNEVQRQNAEQFNKVIDGLKSRGIAEKDIKTIQYDLQPEYEYTQTGRKSLGFVVRQRLEVKVRDLDKVGDVIDTAVQIGSNDVGGLTFTVENPEKLENQVRASAIAKAKVKAEMLAQQAGFKLGKVVNFSEGGGYPMYYKAAPMAEARDVGGAAPSIQAGSYEITSNVSLTYEIE